MIDAEYKRTIRFYALGFIFSLLLTFASYVLVVSLGLRGMEIMISVGVLAFTQLVVQLIFFLHLSDEKKPRWQFISFASMLLIMAIIVAGSIWIMYHMNYNMSMMSPEEKTEYMIEEKDSGF